MSLDFTKVPQAGHETYTFFAASMAAALRHFLTKQGVEEFEILHAAKAKAKYGVVPSGPVRLTDGSPRAEKNIACLVSKFDPDAMAALIQLIPSDTEYIDWTNETSRATIERMRKAGDWEFPNIHM